MVADFPLPELLVLLGLLERPLLCGSAACAWPSGACPFRSFAGTGWP